MSYPACEAGVLDVARGGQLVVKKNFTCLLVSISAGTVPGIKRFMEKQGVSSSGPEGASTAAPQAVEQHQMAAGSL